MTHEPYTVLTGTFCRTCRTYEPWPCRDYLRDELVASRQREAEAVARAEMAERALQATPVTTSAATGVDGAGGCSMKSEKTAL